jgi:hypothetical protein
MQSATERAEEDENSVVWSMCSMARIVSFCFVAMRKFHHRMKCRPNVQVHPQEESWLVKGLRRRNCWQKLFVENQREKE